jgi:YHS domain-containing protein
MDPESLKSLGTLLFWGLLFILMMRFGCGAHMMGGHGHGGHDKHGAGSQERDPVCGMTVDPEKAAGASVHAGKTYYFCSTSCLDEFEKEPARYAAAAARGEHQQGGHHHG